MSYSEFYQRSITQPESFWAEQAQRIDWQQPYTQVLDHSNPPFARWFCGGTTKQFLEQVAEWPVQALEYKSFLRFRVGKIRFAESIIFLV